MKFVFRETLKFAARFLQIPCRHGHPCVKLTATSAFAARDFHPIDYTHAGRTPKKTKPLRITGLVFCLIDYSVSILWTRHSFKQGRSQIFPRQR